MKREAMLTACVLALTAFAATGLAGTEQKGAALFKEKCAACHPDGGNTMKPEKSLKKKDMEKNGLKKKVDVVKYLRKPGPGMPAFDEAKLPKKDAEELAEYVLKAFK